MSKQGKDMQKSPTDVVTASPDAKPHKTKEQLKAERKAAYNASQAAKGNTESSEPVSSGSKSKSQLKAERRAVQEAQRAAKESTKKGAPVTQKKTEVASVNPRVPDILRADDDQATKRLNKKLEKQKVPQRTVVQRKVLLFSHLHQYEREVSLTQGVSISTQTGTHPAILQLGLQYAEGVICGSNSRCVALLGALSKVIEDYSTPPDKELSRDLDARIKPCISFLTQCRQLSVSMGNAINHLKWHINRLSDTSDKQAKAHLQEVIRAFVKEKIQLAGEAISKEYACKKIQEGDVLLVYACSSLIYKVLCDAHDSGKHFQVIVVDGRPKMEGREMLRRLVARGLSCSYVLINSASYVMREVTKVFLGAHALLANGYVMSRVGCSQLALVARAHNVPVLVCCETYKFCERVQSDSFVFNELGDPDDLVTLNNTPRTYLSDWRDMKSLSLLNLYYDVTPPGLISMVITELGMIPCTSVPVVLRVKQTEI